MSQLALSSLILVVLIAAAYDLKTRRIPNALTVPAAFFGLFIGYSTAGFDGLISAAVGFATGMALLLPGFLLRFTGGGDVKLIAAIGTMAGARSVLEIFAVTVLLGALGVIIWGIINSLLGRTQSPLRRYLDMVRVLLATGRISYIRPPPGEAAATRIPFAPLLAGGTLLICLEVINFNKLV